MLFSRITFASGQEACVSAIGKGRVPKKKNRISYGLFTDKKIYPHFFLEIESMIAKTNFTLGPIEKFIFFVKL